MLRALVLALLLRAAAAERPRPVDMSQAYNSTVCPIVSVMNEDPDRTPRRIQMWKCAPDPLALCRARDIPDTMCCHYQYRGPYALQCVELYDSLRVAHTVRELDIARTTWSEMYVSVGCACEVRRVPDGSELPSGPSRRAGLVPPEPIGD